MWDDLWQVDKQYWLPIFPQDVQRLRPLFPCALRSAAASFPVGTGLGADNISPRALTRLSEPALVAFALLLASFGALGKWTQALDLVLIVLLPKLTEVSDR